MVIPRSFFNAVAILFTSVLVPALCSAAGIGSQFVPLERMFQPDRAVCLELSSRVNSPNPEDIRRCSEYRAPTLKQATENIAACFDTEINKVTGTPYIRPLFGWYRFCAEKTNGRDVTADEIRRCFHDSIQYGGLEGRLQFDTCIAFAARKKADVNP